jgi:iron(III) transport system substrate-binding protein
MVIMRLSRRQFGCIFPAAFVGWPVKLAAQSANPVEGIANYSGPDRQAMLEAGARRERGLLLYTTGTQIEPLIQGFERKYPYLKVTVQRGPQTDIARRAIEEYRVGYRKLDMFELSSEGLILIRDANILQPFRSPEVAAFDTDAIEPGRHWVVVRESYIGIGFNTKAIPPGRGPERYEDLLASEWRGRMAMSGSLSTASNLVATLVLTKGEDFVRRLAAQDIRIYPVTARALANLMISGEVTLSPTIYNSHVEVSAAGGAPLRWVAPGPVPVTDTAVALARAAPSPHATMLLIDYLMSQEGQRTYGRLGYGSARLDMGRQAGASPLQKLYLGNRPNYVREFAQWSKLYRDVFLRR